MAEFLKTIGRYEVDKLIGHGAMGAVYKALDPILERQVAIKIVKASGSERDNALRRFKEEAKISAQLNHPNIVTIYDVGEEPSVGPFLAMELIEGQSLGQLIRENSLELETKLAILIQAMRALRAAHRHAIVHRDFKPDNIQVGKDGRIKLMDFGIAGKMNPEEKRLEGFWGSPAYSAPEFLKSNEPTPSSDRYAFAVTAFELLTGDLPHPGSSAAAVITHTLHHPIVIPHGMPAPMAYLFQKALSPDIEERFENLMDFLVALVDACPLDDGARRRVEELFHHDDHAGDIVPIRRSRMRGHPLSSDSPPFGPKNSSARASGGRITNSTGTSGGIRIELEPGNMPQPVRTMPIHIKPTQAPSMGMTPGLVIKWILLVLVFGPIVMWLLTLIGV